MCDECSDNSTLFHLKTLIRDVFLCLECGFQREAQGFMVAWLGAEATEGGEHLNLPEASQDTA